MGRMGVSLSLLEASTSVAVVSMENSADARLWGGPGRGAFRPAGIPDVTRGTRLDDAAWADHEKHKMDLSSLRARRGPDSRGICPGQTSCRMQGAQEAGENQKARLPRRRHVVPCHRRPTMCPVNSLRPFEVLGVHLAWLEIWERLE